MSPLPTAPFRQLDLTYFFTKNIAAELVLGVTPHTVNGTGGITPFGKVGDAWLLPPTLPLQYHFDTGTAFKPYVGGGVNYTIFFDESTGPNSITRSAKLVVMVGHGQKRFERDFATFVMGLWDQRKLIHLAILKLLVPDVGPYRLLVPGLPRRNEISACPRTCVR